MAATLTVDTTGHIRNWSRDAEELLGYSDAEVLGQSIEIIIPQHLRERHGAGFARFVRTGISSLPEVVTTPAVHKTGAPMKLLISVKAVYGDDQQIVGVEAMLRPASAGDQGAADQGAFDVRWASD